MTETLLYSTTLTTLSCGSCHIPFAMPSSMVTDRRRDGGRFYCPNGCKIGWSDDENARLKKQVERVERERDWARTSRDAARDQAAAAERRRAAAKGQLTKVKKRVAAGVCPCCNRTFQDLARHMSGQHPDYTAAPSGLLEQAKRRQK